MEAGAAYVGVSRRQLYRLVESGRLRLVRLPGCRRVLVDRLELDRLLDAPQEGA